MMTENTLDLTALGTEVVEDYRQLVSKTAEGEQPDTVRLRETLFLADRTLEQFQDDVSRSVRRLEAARALAEAEALGPAIDQAKADEQDAAERLREAEGEAAKLVAGPTGDLAGAREKLQRLEAEQSALAKPARMVLANTADATFDTEISDVASSGSGLTNALFDGREAAGKLDFL